MKRAAAVIAATLVLIAATPDRFGGWASVTLLEVPEYLVVGQETTLRFVIRAHGREVLWGRKTPALVTEEGSWSRNGWWGRKVKDRRIPARKTRTRGVYEASFVPEAAGELAIRVNTDLGNHEVALLPFRVIEPGTTPVPLTVRERGEQLFVAKGCAACHAKLEKDENAWMRWDDFGPPLAGRTFPVDYLRRKLEDPAAGRPPTDHWVVMPKLELDAEEVEALVRYLNQK